MEGLGTTLLLGMGLFLFLLWTVVILENKPKYFYRIWIGVPALGLILLVCLVLGIGFHLSRPNVVFRGAVGIEPTKNITIVNSLRHMPIDWDDSYLEFYTDDSTIDQITWNGFASISPSDIIEYGTEPEWWKPPTGPDVRIYVTNINDPQFHDESFRFFLSHKLLIYDPSSGSPSKRHVYFRYRRP